MNRIITYAIDKGTGFVVSRVGSEVAYPVLDYEGMTPANNFTPRYYLETMSVYALQPWDNYRWTRKIPAELKNRHRIFWKMRPLAVATEATNG